MSVMIVRSIDANHDWNFGASLNDYTSGQQAVAELIQLRLLSFLGDCVWDTTAGIAWFTYLGAKNQTALNLAVSAVILNTPDENGNALITGLQQLNIILNHATRAISIQYNAISIYGVVTGQFTYDLNGVS